MRMLSKLICAAAAALAVTGPATASVIFADDFNRGVSDALGNGWSEVEAQPSDVSIVNRSGSDRQMSLQDLSPEAIASQMDGVSTVGYSGITLSYEWAAQRGSEAGDTLFVEWRDGSLGGAWSTLATHALAFTDVYATQSFTLGNLADDIADLELRFRIDVNANNEGVYIDNVVLSGTPSSLVNDVPEPKSLTLVSFALILLGLHRRRASAQSRHRA